VPLDAILYPIGGVLEQLRRSLTRVQGAEMADYVC
jgi:hypothetical protein